MEQYSNVYSTLNNTLLSEVTSVKVNKDPKHNVVETLVKGLAGITLGAKQMTIELDSAVPSADFEVNPDPFMEVGAVVEYGLVMGSRTMEGKAIIMGASYEGGVGASSRVSIQLLATWQNWK